MSKPWQDEFSTAYLPGVGFIVDPQPEDYRRAIRFLKYRFSPACPSRLDLCSPRLDLCDRLSATVRRLEWAPKRWRKRVAA